MRVFRFRRSRRRPPCRRPTNQPAHVTSVCHPATRLLPPPLLLSTACPTSPSELHRLVRPRRRRLRPLCPARRHPPYCRPTSQPSHATSMCHPTTRLLPSPLLLPTACTTPLSDLLRPVRAARRRRHSLRRSRRRPPCRRPASNQPSRATFMRRLVTRLPPQPLLRQTPPSAPSPHRRRLRARAAQLRHSLLRPPSTRRQIDSSLAPRATRHLRSTPRLGPLLSQAPPSAPPLQRQHLRPRTVRPRQPLRRSFRCPPRRRPASGKPPHATRVRRQLMRLLQLPRLSSTSCATSLANLPRLVWPRRRRPRPLLRSPLHWSSRRPASGQPSHSTLERHFVTRLLPLALATWATRSAAFRRHHRCVGPPQGSSPHAHMRDPHRHSRRAVQTHHHPRRDEQHGGQQSAPPLLARSTRSTASLLPTRRLSVL